MKDLTSELLAEVMTSGSRRRVSFTVFGLAQTKGSTRAFTPKGWSRPVIVNDNPKAKGWASLVSQEARSVTVHGPFLGPVVLVVTFHLPRPKSLPKRVRHHVRRPDLDKLVRCTKDALTGVLYRDDSQVVDLHARKVYVASTFSPHAVITVEEAIDDLAGYVAVLFS